MGKFRIKGCEQQLNKKLGCLHAHFSNVDYMQKAFSPYEIELVHFVDPGLLYKVESVGNLQAHDVKNKAKEQIEWMAQCGADAILITCTTYIAILEEVKLNINVPIIKIDEPFFSYICRNKKPQTILFSNPATVEGTIKRLQDYADSHHQMINFEVMTIPDSFELIMKGLKEQYDQKIRDILHELTKIEDKVISVAQLSMADAAKQVEKETTTMIINPLNTLVSSVVEQLKLNQKHLV